jgi:hypothetical protein
MAQTCCEQTAGATSKGGGDLGAYDGGWVNEHRLRVRVRAMARRVGDKVPSRFGVAASEGEPYFGRVRAARHSETISCG